MIKVMILDDESIYLEKEKNITESYFAGHGIECHIETCQNGEWFLSGLKEEMYDLYILDIEMPGKNGLEIAREIRKQYAEPFLIFATNYTDYAIEAYEVNTYRYIPKKYLEEKLPEAYESLIPFLLEKEEQYYIIEKKGEIEKIAYSDIYYLRKEGKYVVISHKNGESRVRKSLAQVQEELDSREFLLIDKGYVVNLYHVMKIKGYEAYMKDGTRLPVGIAKSASIKRAISDFWGGTLC